MNNVTVNEVNFGGAGNAAQAEYYDVDAEVLRSQLSTAGVGQVNVIYQGDTDEVTALIGLDSHGNQLHDLTDLVILPCPPYCGENSGRNKNTTPYGSNTVTFAEAQAFFNTGHW